MRDGLRSPLFRRIFGAVAVLAFLPVLATGVGAVLYGRTAAAEETALRLRSDALLVRGTARADLARGDIDAADALAKRLGRELATRFTFVGGSGAVLGDSDRDPRTMENHASRPEIVAARERGLGLSQRWSETLQLEMIYVAVPIDEADPKLGFVRVALPRSALEKRFHELLVGVLLVGSPAGVLAFLSIGVTLLALVRSVSEVTTAARSVATGGRLTPMAAGERADEIGDLAHSVTAMSAELEHRIALLERERNEVATIVAGIEEGLIAVDGRARLLLSNDAAARLLGVPGLAAGASAVDVIPHGDIVGLVREAIESRASVGRTVTLYAASGPERDLEVRATPLANGQGAVVLLRDVTEAARYERLRRDFVANISHELRTPLALVKGFLETLEDGALQDPEKGPRFVQIAHRHVDALGRLVEDLLTLGKLDARAETRPAEPVEVGEIAEGVLAGFEEVVARKGLRLEKEIPEGLPLGLGHRDLIERAIRNLVDNAVKYTEKGEVRLRIAKDQEHLVVEVADTGPGIPRDDLGRIFERFYRVEKSRSREAGGTGLGLAIVKHIAQQEGGAVSVESEPGKGSRFRLTLRVAS